MVRGRQGKVPEATLNHASLETTLRHSLLFRVYDRRIYIYIYNV